MIGNNWDIYLKDIYNEQWFKDLMTKVNNEYKSKIIYPLYDDIFNALKYTDYDNVKVVIIGQDPYHGPLEAHGLAFSVQSGIKLPPSLKNIYKELYNDLGICNETGNLSKWAKEGVLLLNTILTVEKDKPMSHKDIGWQQFTDSIIKIINDKDKPIIFILWGKTAQEKEKLITNKNHIIIKSPHPSPFSARTGFFGSKPFSKTNEFLKKNNIDQIDFKL